MRNINFKSSWFVSTNVLKKTMAKSELLNFQGFIIAKNYRGFFGVDNFKKNKSKKIKLIFNGIKLIEEIYLTKRKPPQTRLNFSTEFLNIFKSLFKIWNENYDKMEKKFKNPIIIFEKLENDSYKIDFLAYDKKTKEKINNYKIKINRNKKLEIKNINYYIKQKGFNYPDGTIKNFFLSLKTKPFVLLAGISGTGKTKLVELFSQAIGYELNIIPVKPDWNDISDLLGYNNIEGKFIEGPLYKVLKEANGNPKEGYIVCLDEMNLARVEYYFSDILSRMETKNKEIDLSGEKIELPSNLYIVGTVNMDETTHPFSKKVLDRANTIEFSNVKLNQLPFDIKNDNEYEKLNLDNSFLNSKYKRLIDCEDKYHSFIKDQVVSKLVQINSILKKSNLHIGYRIRDEICFYMLYNKKYDLMSFEKALDYQMMQKILPRIQGSSQSIKELLIKLFEFFTVKIERDEYKILKEMEKVLDSEMKYPMSTQKVYYMFKNYKEDGFTAYWL